MPIYGFFEWKDIYSTGKDKQPYAIAMQSGEPFALAAIWEMWHDPKTEERIRTFCVLTCEPNEMMATIHNRMPVILAPADYSRWLMDEDPRDLLRPFPAELMTMWPINRKVGSPKNDTPTFSIVRSLSELICLTDGVSKVGLWRFHQKILSARQGAPV